MCKTVPILIDLNHMMVKWHYVLIRHFDTLYDVVVMVLLFARADQDNETDSRLVVFTVAVRFNGIDGDGILIITPGDEFLSITPCTDATWNPADSGNWLGMTNDKDDVVPIGDSEPLLYKL